MKLSSYEEVICPYCGLKDRFKGKKLKYDEDRTTKKCKGCGKRFIVELQIKKTHLCLEQQE